MGKLKGWHPTSFRPAQGKKCEIITLDDGTKMHMVESEVRLHWG